MPLKWEHCKHGHVPKHAVCGGWEASNGEPLYVGKIIIVTTWLFTSITSLLNAGRADHMGSMIVGKVHPSHRCLYVPYGGGEHKKEEYEVLVNPGNFCGGAVMSCVATKYIVCVPGHVKCLFCLNIPVKLI